MRRLLAALVFALLLPFPALAGQVTVQPGETLSEIADRHGVSLSKLMQLNGISKADHIEVGQVLRLPANGRGASAGRSGAGGATGTVKVQEGDTLSDIAERQGMDLDRLMALNGISKADHIEVGQVLKVSGRPAPAAPTYRRGASTHVVQPGESLSEIAEGYGVAMSRLVAINQLDDPDHVEVGRRLKLQGAIPAPAPRPAPARAPRPAVTATAPVAESSPAPVSRATQQASAAVTTAATTVATTAARPPITAAAPARALATTPVVAARPSAIQTAAPVAAARPSTSQTAAQVVAARPVAAAVPAAVPAAASAAPAPRLDWRRYGPLQVDWSGWQPMGGSLVAPVMNAKGDTLYLAINCGARKLNATSVAGDWRTWDNPQADFEQRLVNDLCRSRAS